MAIVNIDGDSGSFVNQNGDTVTYNVTTHQDWFDAGYGAFGPVDTSGEAWWVGTLTAGPGAEPSTTITFSEQVAGVRLLVSGANPDGDNDNLTIQIDGVPVNISTLIANGDAIFIDGGGTTVVDGDALTGDGNGTFSTQDTLLITVPLTSLTLTNIDVKPTSMVIDVDVDDALVVCFACGTLIRAEGGVDMPVEDLTQGDLILTADHGLQPIRWIGSRPLAAQVLHANEKLRPIRICIGALGDGMPKSDLLVSPQHRILVNSKIAQRMFGSNEVLVAAKQLVMLDGIDIAHDVETVEYFHLLFDRHELVFANGAATESLFTGPQALKSVSQEAKEEILTLFPELSDVDYEALSARPLANGRKGRQLAHRHKKNKMQLASGAQRWC